MLALGAAGAGLLIGWLAAPLLTDPGAGLLGSAGAPSITLSNVLLVVAVALGVATLATLVPALRAARLSTMHALADAARAPRRSPPTDQSVDALADPATPRPPLGRAPPPPGDAGRLQHRRHRNDPHCRRDRALSSGADDHRGVLLDRQPAHGPNQPQPASRLHHAAHAGGDQRPLHHLVNGNRRPTTTNRSPAPSERPPARSLSACRPHRSSRRCPERSSASQQESPSSPRSATVTHNRPGSLACRSIPRDAPRRRGAEQHPSQPQRTTTSRRNPQG